MSVRCQFAEGGSLHRGIQYTLLHLKSENESPGENSLGYATGQKAFCPVAESDMCIHGTLPI
jgi:hypothetical protein